MTRFALIAFLAALPFAVVAAPVPQPPARKPFGANGIVARAELDALTFDSRAVPAGALKRDRVVSDKRVVEIQKKVRATGDEGPPEVRPANRYDVAVHMPTVQFKVGDPIPAYFVVRNNRGEELDLDGRIDFLDDTPAVCGDCDLRLADTRTGKLIDGQRLLKITKCGGRDLLVIPANGFYCAKGNLGALPAGEYTLDWRCGEFRSAPVTFCIFDRDSQGRSATRAERPAYKFFRLADDHERERAERADVVPGPGRRFVALDPLEPNEFAAALASGSATDSVAYVPDVRDIPSRDKHVLVSVDWHPYRSGDQIAVTLRAAPPFQTVRFDELPQLHLQVEVSDTRERGRQLLEAVSKKLEPITNFVTPLTIEAHLPEDWRGALGTAESARVAIVVTAREAQLPSDGTRKAFEQVTFEAHPECPTWLGVVRSEFAEVRLPLRLPSLAR